MRDYQAYFSEDQDISQVAGTYVSTNSYDFTATPRAWGPGKIVPIVAQITAAVTSAGAATLQIQVIEDANAALDDGPVVIYTTPALAKAALIAGFTVIFPIPVETIGARYLGLQYVVGTATTTAGTISAWIADVVQTSNSDWTAETGR